MYRALYRKWRPGTFSDVIGQENIVTALQSQITNNKIGHAYIFTGTRGTGKTTCAKIFAKAINCENIKDGNPCGECHVCKGIDSGAVLDVTEIDAASNNGVDNIRDLREETIYTPGVCAYKVYIIDEVHMLSGAAFNALLKIMEEPPSHVVFILATTEIHKVPATILSRCQRYDFVRIGVLDISKRLAYIASEEQINLDSEAADLIARLADGAMRDALSILDTCIGSNENVDVDTVRKMAGVTDRNYLFELSDLIRDNDDVGAIALIAKLREKSIDMKRLCDELILHYRNFMLVSVNAQEDLLSGIDKSDIEKYKEKGQGVKTSQAVRNIKTLCRALERMARSSDARIELELAVFEMCADNTGQIVAVNAVSSDTVKSSATQTPYTPQAPQAPIEQKMQDVDNHNKASNSTAHTAISHYEKDSAAQVARDSYNEQEIPQYAQNNSDTAMQNDVAKYEPIVQNSNVAQTNVSEQQVHYKENTATSKEISQEINVKKAEIVPFIHWERVVEKMEGRDKLLFVNMRGSKAYLDGKRILIDGNELFLDYMRQNKYSNALIRQVIAEVTGKEHPIGPYKIKTTDTQSARTAIDTARELEKQGVPVVIDED